MTPALQQAGKQTTTRGRIIELLLKGWRTVDELAGPLGVTRNAVRSQIALLQREAIVEIKGESKGSRRPSAVYGLRAGADMGPSPAYPAVLAELVKVLGVRLPAREFGSIMKDVGQGMAGAIPALSGSPRERVAGAVSVIRSLGSLAEMSEEGGKIVIKGHGCPISRAVQADERSCGVMESFLARLTGLSVTERCDHGEHPNCRFEIKLPRGK